ncbi:MAG TPA: isochorismate synthase [Ignavibacteriaceae bacterium]
MYYSERPLKNQFFLGINSISTITEKGERRFSSLEKRIKEAGENFISNRRDFPGLSVPLFFGGMKFTVEHSDDNWKDFDDSVWFIPELLYMRSDDKYYFMFNCFASAKVKSESLLSKFENVLKLFYAETEAWDGRNLRVLKKTGVEPKDKKKWKNQVQRVLEKIQDGEVKKIVLSRRIELIFTSDISIAPILKSLADNYPECTLFLFHIGKSTFIGASPETLARADGSQIVFETLAGSAERGVDNASDTQIENDLLTSKKNIYEHEIVVDYLKECLRGSSEELEIGKPTVKKLKNIQHLKTLIKLNLNEHNSFINMVGKIHPTPAVCGSPSDTALNIIKKTENHQRGLYAGLIGWLNFQNEGELVLAIRSGLAVGNKLIVYAGCGIVNGSDPDDEYEETELKLKPFLSIFNNEN